MLIIFVAGFFARFVLVRVILGVLGGPLRVISRFGPCGFFRPAACRIHGRVFVIRRVLV
jgi:hypothetical protein